MVKYSLETGENLFLEKSISKTKLPKEMRILKNFELFTLPEHAKIHMVGIGGISMSALAHMLMHLGYCVSGSDRTETEIVRKLAEAGVNISIGHSADAVDDPDLVCYTAAIHQDNPELVKARSLGIPVMERAELLGQLMQKYKFPVAIAGTHGKTTTTSMLSLVLLEANLDPSILVGGELSQIDGNYKIGKEDYLVFEACEYVESFLHFRPYYTIITNIEEDHLDYFTDINHIIASFRKFTRLNSPKGCIIVCSDDKNTETVVQNIKTKVLRYGIIGKNNDFYAENIRINESGKCEFAVFAYGKEVSRIELCVHGEHNVRNALGVFALAWELGIDAETIKRGLESFHGAKRRFETLGTVRDITVVDDYAHHPTEIKSSLKAAKSVAKGDVWCVFQPHTYSRTKAFAKEFAKALEMADHAIVTDVYPAREEYDGTIHSCDLVEIMDKGIYINDFGAIKRYILKEAKPGDMVITMGAGDISKLGHSLIEK